MMIKYVAVYGPFLETSLVDFTSDVDKVESGYYGANHNFPTINFASEGDAQKWRELENERLYCSWTPNQSHEDQTVNGERIKEIKTLQNELTV